MILTTKQQEGLRIAVERYKQHKPFTVIAGYAGTGKSTLINHIIAALGIKEDRVAYISFTGKAAEVLRRKGCPNACTAHRLLLKYDRETETFSPRTDLRGKYGIIVVDEVSMLPKKMWDLLLSHGIYVLACGDPGQLPPVDADGTHNILDSPHIFLDEIMRQAEDSGIIRLSMAIRNSLYLPYGKGSDVQIVPKNGVEEGMYTWADQILVPTNETRSRINDKIRMMLGKTGAPKPGDKVICLQNHWDILDDKYESPLVNGTIGYIKNIEPSSISYNISPTFTIGPIPTYKIDLENEIGEIYTGIHIDKRYIDQGQKTLSEKQEKLIRKYQRKLPDLPVEMDYGYAITTHRAQGSEWDKVLIFEEYLPYDKIEHKKWMYTAVTRGSKRVVLVR